MFFVHKSSPTSWTLPHKLLVLHDNCDNDYQDSHQRQDDNGPSYSSRISQVLGIMFSLLTETSNNFWYGNDTKSTVCTS